MTVDAAALVLLSRAAIAEDTSGNQMLARTVERDLARYGISGVDIGSLTLSQLSEIRTAFSSNADRNRTDREVQVSVVLDRAK